MPRGAKLTTEMCARCTNYLATTNRNSYRLCGKCQGDLGTDGSIDFTEWKSRGMKREIMRSGKKIIAPPPEVPELGIDEKVTPTIDLTQVPTTILLDEIERRKQEAIRLLRTIDPNLLSDALPNETK